MLGWEIGLARAIGAIVFSIVIGLMMQFIFRKEEEVAERKGFVSSSAEEEKPLPKTILYFAVMVGILVFANWGKPGESDSGIWTSIFNSKWIISGILVLALLYMIVRWFKKTELKEWTFSSWEFAKQILPLLFIGVLAAGFLLGRPGNEGLIPPEWINGLVGGNSILSNFFASLVGAFMYFATLTEVPILQGLIGAGMGKGPALALLLAGPALSLPNMLVIRGVLGTKKTMVFVSLVVVMATLSGAIFGTLK